MPPWARPASISSPAAARSRRPLPYRDLRRSPRYRQPPGRDPARPRRPDRHHRRDLARFSRRLLRLPVCRLRPGAAAAQHQFRRQGRLCRATARHARCRRCQGRGRRTRPDRHSSRGDRRNRRRFAATAAEIMDWPATDAALEPLGADDVCYIQYSSGSTSFPRGVLVTQAALAANARAIATTAWRCARRPLHLLAAALPRHGPGRLLPDAGDDADLGRLPQHHGVRPAPARLARADLALSRHHLVRPDLRLRALRQACRQRHRPRSRPLRAGGSPASAAR
jgi:hypothetical protein